MSFAETRIEDGFIIYRTQGGPGFSTDVVEVDSGFEQRNKNWVNSRGRWEYGDRKISDTELHALAGFFRTRRGRWQGFRFKDWGDYRVYEIEIAEYDVHSQGIIGIADNTDGLIENQLYKKTISGDDGLGNPFVEYRRIAKPVVGSVKIYVNSILLTETADWDLDYSTGLVTWNTVTPGLTDVAAWSGEFDTPVRFDTDQFKAQLIAGEPAFGEPGVLNRTYFYLSALPIVEIRVP